MRDSDHESALADQLLEAVQHLEASRPEQAAPLLRAVCGDAALAAAADLVDVRARAHSLLAQALIATGDPAGARAAVGIAERLATDLGDVEAMPILAGLRAQISGVEAAQDAERHRSRQSTRLAQLSLEEITARVRDPRTMAEVLVRKANAESDAGRPHEAELIARQALRDAIALGDPRLEVLARLSIARADPSQAEPQLRAALQCADQASETGLITAVAKAADLHDVVLPPHPQGGSSP